MSEQTIRTWIWAGCPTVREGDRQTGEDVMMVGAALFDWVSLVAGRCGSDLEARRRLALEGLPI